jgi:hypothetical protein
MSDQYVTNKFPTFGTARSQPNQGTARAHLPIAHLPLVSIAQHDSSERITPGVGQRVIMTKATQTQVDRLEAAADDLLDKNGDHGSAVECVQASISPARPQLRRYDSIMRPIR